MGHDIGIEPYQLIDRVMIASDGIGDRKDLVGKARGVPPEIPHQPIA